MTSASKNVAVIGAGTMGQGIAITILRSGYRVMLIDAVPAVLESASAAIDDFFAGSVRRKRMTPDERTAAASRLVTGTELEAAAGSAVVIEAVPEDLALKIRVLTRIESACDDKTLLHTNTSTLSVTAIAGGLARPDRLVGTHYCNPAPLMPLVEIAPGLRSSPAAVEQTREFVESIGKTAVVLRDSPGLITNFLVVPFENDCIRALEAGWATAEEIDLAVTAGMGFPMGPFRLLDIVGLDVHRAVSTSLYGQLRDPRFAPPPLVDRMIAAGRLGRKCGHGFYDYEEGAA
jgi:3-hydroxybutyryl-CoA dehydrogenase